MGNTKKRKKYQEEEEHEKDNKAIARSTAFLRRGSLLKQTKESGKKRYSARR